MLTRFCPIPKNDGFMTSMVMQVYIIVVFGDSIIPTIFFRTSQICLDVEGFRILNLDVSQDLATLMMRLTICLEEPRRRVFRATKSMVPPLVGINTGGFS